MKTPIVTRLVHMRKKLNVVKITNSDGIISYKISKFREFSISSNYPGWKIILFLTRWLAWSYNSSYWLLKQGIYC